MTVILGIILISAICASVAWSSLENDLSKKPKTTEKSYIWVLLALGFIIHIIAAASYRGHETDMNCFSAWSYQVFENGLSQFYLSDGFHDYPPGYVYIMYVLGALQSLFSLEGAAWWVILKLPSIVADMGIAYLAYKLASKNFKKSTASIISALILFNPAVILNTCIWGQVDSLLAFFAVLSIYFMAEKRFPHSFFAFGAAMLIKPQAIFFAPILVFGAVEEVFKDKSFNGKKLFNLILWAAAAVACLFILFMPFGNNPIQGIGIILSQYIETIGQYKYMTINAFNLYGIFGANWTELSGAVSVIGYLLMIAVVVFAGIVFFRKKGQEKYYLTAFILIFGIYMLAPKMHERYGFPGIFMLIMLLASAPTGKNFILYCLFSLAQFFNIAWVLFIYETNPGMYFKSPVISVASVINLVLFIFAVYYAFKKTDTPEIKKAVKTSNENKKKADNKTEFKGFRLSEKAVKITAFDIAFMMMITLIYGCIAFYKLGDKYAPETSAELCENTITVDLGEEQKISDMAFFLGARNLDENRNLTFSYFDRDRNQVKEDMNESGSVFKWTMRENIDVTAQYVVISSNCTENPNDPSDRVYLNEVCLFNTDGNIITPKNITDDDVSSLFDEQDYFAEPSSYMSGTYFDEIYHPRTAYEFIHGMSVYEWTHPPLGKVLMGIGIAIFGMVPFGWRFIGTLFGVFMVPVVYIFAKRCFKNKWFAALACLIYTFDFMHFTQTRLATIDTYVTLFIMLMYYYMYKYYKQSFYDRPLYKTLIPLGLSGLFFGLSVASKWTGLYAGAGLAIIFFITVYDRYKEYQYAMEDPKGETDGISHKKVIDSFKKNTIITLIFCCVMFIAVPFAIYALSYIPYMNTPSGEGFKTIFTNAQSMYTYHSKTVVASTHPYSSYWFEWPIMYRPLWYYSNVISDTMRQGISAMGNPAVWWAGIPAVAYCLALTIIVPLKDKKYFGKDKRYVAVIYTAVFALLCLFAGIKGNGNENLTRLLPCMLLYSAVMVAVFIVTLIFDDKITQKSVRTPLFLLIGYFANYMPWMLVLRTTYIYHYFPCVIFAVLMTIYSIKVIYENAKNKKAVIYCTIAYAVAVVILFVMFYPVISGQPINSDFVQNWLRWFESWVLVA